MNADLLNGEAGCTFAGASLLGVMVVSLAALLGWRSRRCSIVMRLRVLCLIGLLQVAVGLLALHDQWREARGETSIREWLRQELRLQRQSQKQRVGLNNGSHQSPLDSTRSPPHVCARQSARTAPPPFSPPLPLADESPHPPYGAQLCVLDTRLVSGAVSPLKHPASNRSYSWGVAMTPNSLSQLQV